jgi:hypothetical protein
VVNFDVPCLPVDRFVVEYDKLVGFAGEELSLGFPVVERSDTTIFDSDRQLAVLQDENARGQLLDSHKLFRLRYIEFGDRKQVATTTSYDGQILGYLDYLLPRPW